MPTVLGEMPNRRWSRWKHCCFAATRKSLTPTSRTTGYGLVRVACGLRHGVHGAPPDLRHDRGVQGAPPTFVTIAVFKALLPTFVTVAVFKALLPTFVTVTVAVHIDAGRPDT